MQQCLDIKYGKGLIEARSISIDHSQPVRIDLSTMAHYGRKMHYVVEIPAYKLRDLKHAAPSHLAGFVMDQVVGGCDRLLSEVQMLSMTQTNTAYRGRQHHYSDAEYESYVSHQQELQEFDRRLKN